MLIEHLKRSTTVILNSRLLEDERFAERHAVLVLLRRQQRIASGTEIQILLARLIGDIESERHLK